MILTALMIRNVLSTLILFVAIAIAAYPAFIGYHYVDVYGADATLIGYAELLTSNIAY